MCSMTGIYVQGYVPLMWNVCIPVFLVTFWLHWVHMMYLYWHIYVIHAYKIFYICGMCICCWPNMTVTCEVDIAVGCVVAQICRNAWSICPCNIMAVWVIYAMSQSYLSNDIKFVYIDNGNKFGTHACTHACMHFYMHTYRQTHLCLAIYIPKCIHSYMCAFTHSCQCTYIHTYTFMHVWIYTYMHTSMYA